VNMTTHQGFGEQWLDFDHKRSKCEPTTTCRSIRAARSRLSMSGLMAL